MQGRGGWLGVKPEGSIAEGRARAARAGGCGVNTQKRTRGGRPHQPEMARTLPLRCFPAGLKAVAVLACPPPRPALPGRPRAAEPTASPWRETRPAQRKPGSRAQGSRATQAFYRGGFLRRLRGGGVSAAAHSRPPAPRRTKRRPPSSSLPTLGLGRPSPFSAGNLFSPYLLCSQDKLSCCVPAPPTQLPKQAAQAVSSRGAQASPSCPDSCAIVDWNGRQNPSCTART